jgi:hypothetical protein
MRGIITTRSFGWFGFYRAIIIRHAFRVFAVPVLGFTLTSVADENTSIYTRPDRIKLQFLPSAPANARVVAMMTDGETKTTSLHERRPFQICAMW